MKNRRKEHDDRAFSGPLIGVVAADAAPLGPVVEDLTEALSGIGTDDVGTPPADPLVDDARERSSHGLAQAEDRCVEGRVEVSAEADAEEDGSFSSLMAPYRTGGRMRSD